MKIEEVKTLSPIRRFLYWIRERHSIYLKKRAGRGAPWTDDEVLQSYFFTNPYRENDKVTVWFRDNVREPLRDDPAVILATVIFRWFNWPPTGESLKSIPSTPPSEMGMLTGWDHKRTLKCLSAIRGGGEKIFTGAYMINSPGKEKKLEAVCRRIELMWKDRQSVIDSVWECPTLQEAHKALTQYEGIAGFMGYEIVTDLRHTGALEGASDILTWCNPGPGAVRGLCRLLEIDFEKGNNGKGFSPAMPGIDKQEEIRKLLATTQKRLKGMPPFEMREIEHSLCEWDKYERALWGDGQMKRLYRGS